MFEVELGLIRIVKSSQEIFLMQRAYTWSGLSASWKVQTSWPGGMPALVGWEIFSAACQEKRAAFKYSETTLKEKEQCKRKEELQGWVDRYLGRGGKDAELES